VFFSFPADDAKRLNDMSVYVFINHRFSLASCLVLSRWLTGYKSSDDYTL